MDTNKKKTYAVIGASVNKDKYGFKVLKHLKDSGSKVIPINPKSGEILESKVYPSILDYPDKIDTAIFVTQPEITEEVLKQIKQKGIQQVWLQPGSESKTAIEFCTKNNIQCTHHACIMIQ